MRIRLLALAVLVAPLLAGHATATSGCSADGTAIRCAGVAVPFHRDGVSAATGRLWAGRWQFTDDRGQRREGSCVLNRGVHPDATTPAAKVDARLALDPDGRLAGYLLWRYGNASDPGTAAAVWVALHHLAGDAAGGGLGGDPNAPLVPSLAAFATSSGRSDLAALASAFENEARRFVGPWTMSARYERGSLLVSVRAGAVPVPRTRVTVLVSGSDSSLAALTGADGVASLQLAAASAARTAVVSVATPGAPEAFRGSPAVPSAVGSQVLLTAGPPDVLHTSVALDAVTTTVPSAPTTDPSPVDTVDTVPASSSTVVQLPPTIAPTTVVSPPSSLPFTGGHLDGGIALTATAMLVGGVGLLGTLRRGASSGFRRRS